MAIAEACDAFKNALIHFGYNRKLEKFDPKVHQVHHQPTSIAFILPKLDSHSK